VEDSIHRAFSQEEMFLFQDTRGEGKRMLDGKEERNERLHDSELSNARGGELVLTRKNGEGKLEGVDPPWEGNRSCKRHSEPLRKNLKWKRYIW
jgi:hypothetical protein